MLGFHPTLHWLGMRHLKLGNTSNLTEETRDTGTLKATSPMETVRTRCWEGQSKKSATRMVSPIRLCFLEEVLLPLKCLKLCEAFASWNSLFAPVFLLTQIPSLIELITPL